jgi:transcriptional/translational regulatory protein YebC/TACO1
LNETAQKSELKIISASLEWMPKITVAINNEAAVKLREIIEKLEDLDDVTNVFTNAE